MSTVLSTKPGDPRAQACVPPIHPHTKTKQNKHLNRRINLQRAPYLSVGKSRKFPSEALFSWEADLAVRSHHWTGRAGREIGRLGWLVEFWKVSSPPQCSLWSPVPQWITQMGRFYGIRLRG